MAKRSAGAEATFGRGVLHIDRQIRRLALQSAVGEILLSILGMVLAAAGLLPPVEAAIAQEAIDIWAVLNAFGCCYRA